MLDTKARSTHPKSTKRQRTLAKGKPIKMKCPYCGRPMQLRSGDKIYKENSNNRMLYVCSDYPRCDSYVRTHDGSLVPIGTPANSELRRLRYEAHLAFDQLWDRGLMSKKEAYAWLGLITGLPEELAHIGVFRESRCNLVISESRKLLKRQAHARLRAVNKPQSAVV